MAFYIGSTWRSQITCKANGTLTDPTTVTLKVRDPSGTETSYTYGGGTVTRSSLGVFYKDIPITAGGIWTARWIGTGAVPEAYEAQIEVQPTRFTSP